MRVLLFIIIVCNIVFANLKMSEPFIQIMHSNIIGTIDANEKYLISGDNEGVVKVWDMRTKRLLKTINANNSELISISIL